MPSIRIRYCRVWNYQPRAARVAALIETELHEDAQILEGARGEFTVWVGDECVAKKDADGFPDDRAIVEAVRRRLEATHAGGAMRS